MLLPTAGLFATAVIAMMVATRGIPGDRAGDRDAAGTPASRDAGRARSTAAPAASTRANAGADASASREPAGSLLPAAPRGTPSSRALATGTLVDVGGRRLFLRCVGGGATSVIFEAGAGGSSSSWWRVLPMVGGFTRACAYDRAGRGRSDAAPSRPSAAETTDDLRAALEAAGIRPPYVLVAHSFGAVYARLYASRHPSEMAGLVLVDPVPVAADRLLAALGPELRTLVRREIEAREGLDWDASLRQLREAPALGDLPLVVIAAGRRPRSASGDLIDEFQPLWRAGQEALAKLSSKGRLVVAERSGHFVQEEEPDLVVETIRRLVEGR